MSRTSIYPRKDKLNKRTKFTQEHNRWNYANTRRYLIAITRHIDGDIIDWLEAHKPYQTTIKRLIREEMVREATRESEAQNKPL